MPKENVLTIQMPSDLKHRIALVAQEQGVSINQLVLYIFAKEIGTLEAGHKMSIYWKEYAQEDIVSGFDEVMAKVQERPVPDWDRMP